MDEFDLPVSGRWRIEKLLGTGSFGVVYAAMDLRRSERVALKTLRRFEPADLARFKREFRLLSDLVHPNLVSLYELVSEGAIWFFTMELIDGTDLLTYCRFGHENLLDDSIAPTPEGSGSSIPASEVPTSPDDSAAAVKRVRSTPKPVHASQALPVFRQLAEGLAALHQAGKLHRDIKPSNIMVDRNARVVVLDFGLATDVEHTTTRGGVAGTVAYMSPEQAAGRPLDEASDWYSFGVVLYETLTGRRPIEGEPTEVLWQKQIRDPASARELVPEIPPELDTLCSRLLSRDPQSRPRCDEVFSALGMGPVESDSQTAVDRPVLVGRARESQFLREAFEEAHSGRMVTVYVHGESGIGKSLLVQRFLEQVHDSGRALVLQGRCYERESVPYKALDSLVDALARYLVRFRPAEATSIIPHSIGALARIFPVLWMVSKTMKSLDWTASVPDPQEQRRRAAVVFQQLLRNLSRRRPVVLFIDDLQWGDTDSAALLADLMRGGMDLSVLLVTCFRSEDRENAPCLRALPQAAGPDASIRELQVGGLDPAQAAGLWRIFRRRSALDELEGDFVPDTQGNPFLLQELARYGSESRSSPTSAKTAFQDILNERVQRLPDEAARLLTLVALAGQPISEAAAERAAAVEGLLRVTVGLLRSEHLIRTVGDRADRLVAYHDRIREAVVTPLDPTRRREGHARIAAALEHTREAAPETLADHHDAAGNHASAAGYSAAAARRASEALAFGNAARLYQRALQLRSQAGIGSSAPDLAAETRELQVGLAQSLANAGRGVEAAEAFLAAAESTVGKERLELQQDAAEQLLHTGHIDRGLGILKTVLSTVGLPFPKERRIPLELIYWRLLNRLRGVRWRERAATDLPADLLLRIDACSSASTGLALVDIARGAALQAVNLALSLSAGEPYRVARALAMEAGYRSTGGERAKHQADQLIEVATELSRRNGQPQGLGLSLVMSAGCAWNDGRWRECRTRAKEARAVLQEQCQGVTWERDTADIFEVDALRWMGRWSEMKAILPPLIANAKSRGDLYAETILQMHCGSCSDLADDDPERALIGLTILDRWSSTSFYVEHLIDIHNQVEIALYRGDGRTALTLLDRRWPALRRSLLLRVQTFRIQMLSLRARAALGAARAAQGGERASLLTRATRDSDAILRERTQWRKPIVGIIQACAAALQSKTSLAIDLFRQAESDAHAVEMILHGLAAKRCRGMLMGGDDGHTVVADAESGMTAESIVNPGRISAVIAPCGIESSLP